ncbi:MAG: hypothetical protein JXQ75_01105 [Phycisphaerae bacterium]|nr:hypothetical protein [Phycisphaerae bacterium]
MENTTAIVRPGKGVKRIVQLYAGGGFAGELVRRVESVLAGQPGIASRYLDTDRPAGLPSTRFFPIEPQHLPEEPDERLTLMLKDIGLPVEKYQTYRRQTGKGGVAQLPQLSHLATLWKLNDLIRACEEDFRILAASVGGSEETVLATVSTGAGGTGAAAVRNAGLASRVVYPTESHVWHHYFISTSLLPTDRVTRRNRALEHRQLAELSALMKPGIALRVPGRQAPIHRPGPDFIYLLASSPAAPRTFDDVAQELAVTFRNFVTQ